MLDNEARTKLQMIQNYISQIWGNNCKVSETEVIDSPYPEFQFTLWLYDKIQVGIYYDRSTLDIGIMQNGEYLILQKFTQEKVERGFKATKPENLYNNFCILDRVAKWVAGIN